VSGISRAFRAGTAVPTRAEVPVTGASADPARVHHCPAWPLTRDEASIAAR
jgi:hypothetical protein